MLPPLKSTLDKSQFSNIISTKSIFLKSQFSNISNVEEDKSTIRKKYEGEFNVLNNLVNEIIERCKQRENGQGR